MKAAIFDMDGTLIDSMWVWQKTDETYSERKGITLTEEEHKLIAVMTFDEVPVYLKEKYNIEDDIQKMKDDIMNIALELFDERVVFKDGVLDYIKMLKDEGVKTAIATASTNEFVNIVLDKCGSRELFDVVLTSYDIKSSKRESSEIYDKCCALLGTSKSDCVVFEDAFHAAKTAKKAGYYVIGVHDEHNLQDREEFNLTCDKVIDSWRELM